jgi:hypothetical protein
MKHSLFSRLSIWAMFGIVAILLSIILTPLSTQAHTIAFTSRNDAPSESVTILDLDMSGSMATSDPNGLRCSAANAYIDLSGPGNFIGVIGLDGKGDRGGPHNFEQSQTWVQPTEMATLAQRQQLQSIIAAKSNHCQPDNTTPTYDSLNKALQMLDTATHGGQIPGSVVLLTDGIPDPDTIDQINAIKTDLLPQFKQHNWSIDTVALGTDAPISGTNTAFHGFLSGLSDATSGKFYDDGNGIVPGVSPLNIAPFFVDIFARHNNRTVKNDIDPTPLYGDTTRRNFTVTDYTSSLDVVVVKDQPGTTASLRTPDGHVISQTGSGVFVSSSDPHYEIFSIEQPQAGTWEIDVTGTGQFLMKSLKVSGIGLSAINVAQSNLTVSAQSALALGQPLTISAGLTNNGQPITDHSFTLNGTITYSGALGRYSQNFTLNDKDAPGTYTAKVIIPSTAPTGSYEILLQASTVSLAAVVVSQDRFVRIERFPLPLFISPQTHQPTEGSVNTTVVQWDPVLRTFYGLPFWPIPQIGQWPLSNLPAQPDADVAGQVELQQQPYSAATVTAEANRAGSATSIPVTVVNDGNGRFQVLFPPSANGTYLVIFKTSGTFGDSHGDFGTTQRTVNLIIVPATLSQEIQAWAVTGFYLLCLLFIIYLLRFFIMPHPFGEWVCSQEGEIVGHFSFRRARRNPLQWFFQPNLLYSRQANMPRGLLFRFRRGGIEVQPDGRAGADWQSSDGSRLSTQFREMRELRFRPGGDDDADDALEPALYAIRTQQDRHVDVSDDDDYRSSTRRQRVKRSSYDEDYNSSQTRTTRTRQESGLFYNDEDSSSRTRKSAKRNGKRSQQNYEDEW